MNISEQKKLIREIALRRRDALPLDYRNKIASKLVSYVGEWNISPKQIISAFLPMRSEIDLRPLMEELAVRGARLCLPAILDQQSMEFREFLPNTQMIDMGFGTIGPAESSPVLEPEVMLIPLAAFDARGHRIGYGGGYYDRAIARLHQLGKNPRLIGTAFECQRTEHVPDEPHDMPLKYMLSETGLHSFSAL